MDSVVGRTNGRTAFSSVTSIAADDRTVFADDGGGSAFRTAAGNATYKPILRVGDICLTDTVKEYAVVAAFVGRTNNLLVRGGEVHYLAVQMG